MSLPEPASSPEPDIQTAALKQARQPSWGRVNRARLEAVLRHAGQTLLDVGCATGDYVDSLTRRGYTAYGVDLLVDPGWRDRRRPSFAAAQATRLPFPGQAFETVTAFEVLEHIPDPGLALAEFHRVCSRNLILSVPDCEQPEDLLRAGLVFAHWRDRTHCNFYTRDTLALALDHAGFQVQAITRINHILPDYLVLRSFAIPPALAYLAARVLRRIPFRSQYPMTLLAVANKI